MQDLDDVLGGVEPEAEAEVEVLEATDDASLEAATDEETPTGEEPGEQPETSASPAEPEVKTSDSDVIAGIQAELARVREKNRRLEDAANAVPEEKLDFFDDPDAAINTLEQRMEQKIARTRIDISEQIARDRYPDFDDKIKVFTDLANENPNLWSQMSANVDPAGFAYKAAQNAAKMKEMGNVEEFEAKIRADERARAKKEYDAEYGAKLKERANLPGSLSDTRATGGNNSPGVTNESLEDVVGYDASHR